MHESIDDPSQGSFVLNGHRFVVTMPRTADDPIAWTLTVTRLHDGEVVAVRTEPMFHEPIFGPDVEDVAALDDLVERVIVELGLE